MPKTGPPAKTVWIPVGPHLLLAQHHFDREREDEAARLDDSQDENKISDLRLSEKILQDAPPPATMIGLDDKRVPTSQGIEFYRALKARGVPIR